MYTVFKQNSLKLCSLFFHQQGNRHRVYLLNDQANARTSITWLYLECLNSCCDYTPYQQQDSACNLSATIDSWNQLILNWSSFKSADSRVTSTMQRWSGFKFIFYYCLTTWNTFVNYGCVSAACGFCCE